MRRKIPGFTRPMKQNRNDKIYKLHKDGLDSVSIGKRMSITSNRVNKIIMVIEARKKEGE